MSKVNPNKVVFTAFAVCAFLISGNASANPLLVSETPPEAQSTPDELAQLRLRIDQLESKIQASKSGSNAFNPAITVFGNVMGCFSGSNKESKKSASSHEHNDHDHAEHEHGEHEHDDHAHKAHEHGEHKHGERKHDEHKDEAEHEHAHSDCPNTIWLREVEIEFSAAIGPNIDGVLIAAIEQEHPGEFGIEIEEGYVLLKSGAQLKLGRFLSSFGRINRIHLHDLPQMTRPMSANNFFGQHGLIQEGASAQFHVPTPGEENALSLNLEVLFGKAANLGDKENSWPKFVARMSWFFDLNNGHDLDLGASTLIQPRTSAAAPFQVYGADLNYRWRPFLLGSKRSFLLGGEMFIANEAANSYHNVLPIGGFAWTQVQFNENAYLGFRYSYDQGATKEHLLNTSLGVFLTYYTTEFLRARVGYDRVSNNVGFADGRDLFMAELNFIFGSHPVEPYWVNR